MVKEFKNIKSKENDLSDLNNDIENKIKFYDLSKSKTRKNSKDSDGYSTSNEDNQEKEKNNEKKKFKCPFKTKALDFNIKYKTELCKNYEIKGYCKYGENCAYAHGKENLRLKVTNTTAYRTKKCVQFFKNGYCPYGSRCQFAHQLESNITNNPFDKKMNYSLILDTFSKIENIRNINNIIEKPRLPVFKEISKKNENIPSRLLFDIKNLFLYKLFTF